MKKLLLGLGLLVTLSANAKEGGNGGYSYVCRGQDGKIVSARLLDLWEPETFSTFQDNSNSVETQIDMAVKKVEAFFPAAAQKLRALIASEMAIIFKTGRKLPVTNDAIPRYATDPGCNYEQVARHGHNIELEKDVLEINKEIYEDPSFSNSDRAALLIHEAIYTSARDRGEKDSNKVRILVAKLFSDVPFSAKDKSRVDDFIGVGERLYIENDMLLYGSFKLMGTDFYRGVAECNGGTCGVRRGTEVECKLTVAQSGKVIASISEKSTIERGMKEIKLAPIPLPLSTSDLSEITIEKTCTQTIISDNRPWSSGTLSLYYGNSKDQEKNQGKILFWENGRSTSMKRVLNPVLLYE